MPLCSHQAVGETIIIVVWPILIYCLQLQVPPSLANRQAVGELARSVTHTLTHTLTHTVAHTLTHMLAHTLARAVRPMFCLV